MYIFEVLVKLFGLGFRKWASSLWNIYDGIIISMLLATSIPRFYYMLSVEWNIVYKLLLICVAFRLAQRNEALDTLFRAVQHANFRDFGLTILTLFRMATGENWDFLMHDYSVQSPQCVEGEDCGSSVAATTLFVMFYVICTYIFVNLFTVIVINNFSFTFDKRNRFTLVTRTDLRYFKEAWSEFDPRATGYMDMNDVPGFLRKLKGILAIHIYDSKHSLQNLLKASNKIDRNSFHYVSVPGPAIESTALSTIQSAIPGERLYNFYAVNKLLSTINVEKIRDRRNRYIELYQEILYTSGSRGIAFHEMLEILAIRLVDVTKSLTFDELVHRAKKQEKIDKMLAQEKAKSFVAMLLVRRKYLKARQLKQEREMPSPGHLDDWEPDPANRRVSNTRTKSADGLQQPIPTSPVNAESPVPMIVIEKPQQLLQSPLSKGMDENKIEKGTSPEPEPAPAIASSSEAPLGSPKLQRKDKPVFKSLEPLHSQVPLVHADVPRLAPAPALRRSLSERRGGQVSGYHEKQREWDPKEQLPEQTDDIFTKYYAVDSMMETMPSPDAQDLNERVAHSQWSDMLKDIDKQQKG
ncbi:uncharacterized protein BYT42DRAFT_617171 [Radiomyces spectabilis]|uniref:uncharacterized protein n=1 Tax=Radiomyces spectabilis TaxID=64574 RepID=UPI00222058CC|nr:uncharacterized protein BYT42DRAFT_617171 [Radiomyces spectabilis]KAI8370634.1 hypothetical protein BYT42DRAFT_617171 [Radiomyces spectabilis]